MEHLVHSAHQVTWNVAPAYVIDRDSNPSQNSRRFIDFIANGVHDDAKRCLLICTQQARGKMQTHLERQLGKAVAIQAILEYPPRRRGIVRARMGNATRG